MTDEQIDFVDTHVHFWDRQVPELRHDWLPPGGDPDETAVLGEYGAIRAEKYLPEDFERETRSVRPSAVVHVQAALGSTDPVRESAWLNERRQHSRHPSAFVGDARLGSDGFETVVRRHAQYPGFRGIRDLGLSEHIEEDRCQQNLALMAKEGLVLCDADAMGRLEATEELLAAHPDLAYCVDHAMMPMRRDPGYAREWQSALNRIAAFPQTVIKVSGLGQTDHDWTVDSLRPWILGCLDAFGTDRTFFGTNWPVDRLYSSYADVVAAYVDACSDLNEQERHAVLSGNARRVFGIDEPR